MKKTLCIVAGVMFTSLPVSADSLLDVYRQAVDNDPTVLASEASFRSVSEGVVQSRASFLPQLSAGARRTVSDFDIEGEISPGVPSSPFNSQGRTTSWNVQLQQQIFDWSTWKAYAQSKLRVNKAEVDYGAELQNLIVRVAERYFDVLAAEDSLELSQAETEAFSKELEQARQRYEVGLTAVTDVYQAQANYDSALSREITAKNTLDNAFEALREITGQYHYDLLKLKEDLPLVPPVPNNIDDWVLVANEQNLSLQASKLDVEIAREEIGRQRAGHYPTLNLDATYSDTEQDNSREFETNPAGSGTTTDLNDGTQINLRLNVPIFSGFATQSRTRQARHDFQRSTQLLEQQQRLVQRNTRSSFLGVDTSMNSVKANIQSVKSNQSALEATQAGYEVGTRTIVDVLLNTRSLYSARRDLSRARYDYVVNTLKLKQAAGILTAEDLEMVNAWLR